MVFDDLGWFFMVFDDILWFWMNEGWQAGAKNDGGGVPASKQRSDVLGEQACLWTRPGEEAQ